MVQSIGPRLLTWTASAVYSIRRRPTKLRVLRCIVSCGDTLKMCYEYWRHRLLDELSITTHRHSAFAVIGSQCLAHIRWHLVLAAAEISRFWPC